MEIVIEVRYRVAVRAACSCGDLEGDEITMTEDSIGQRRPRTVPLVFPRGLMILLVTAAAMVVIAGLRAFSGSLAPLFLGVVVVVLVRPVQTRILAAGRPRWMGFVGMLAAGYGILLGILAVLVWSLTQLASYLAGGSYTDRLDELRASIRDGLDGLGVTEDQLNELLDGIDAGAVIGRFFSVFSGLLGVFGLLGIVVLAMFFAASDTGRFVRILEYPGARSRPDLVSALNDFAVLTRRYFFVNSVFGLVVAVIDIVILVVLGVELALVWGVLAFITSFIPNVGFVIGMIPPILIALLENGVGSAVAVGVCYVVVNTVVDNVVKPKFVGDAVGLSASLTFGSLIFWAWVFGPIGALLAVPMSLFVKAVLIDADPQARWMTPLIGLPDIEGAEEPVSQTDDGS